MDYILPLGKQNITFFFFKDLFTFIIIYFYRNSPVGVVANGFTISNMSLYDMEESFTIHLGSQMKSTHNIRIMSADTLNLLRLTLDENGYVILWNQLKKLNMSKLTIKSSKYNKIKYYF